MFSYIICITAL